MPDTACPPELRRGNRQERRLLRRPWFCRRCGDQIGTVYVEGDASVEIKCRCHAFNVSPHDDLPARFARLRQRWSCQACGRFLATVYLVGRSSVEVHCRCRSYQVVPPEPLPSERVAEATHNGASRGWD